MKLKEFSLWAFKLELTEARNFTLFNRSVCAHFERHFEPIETEAIYRVVVKLSDLDERSGITESSSSVLKFYQTFDFNTFNTLREKAKKRYLLDALYAALIRLCDKYGWPRENFDDAYQQVIEDDFVNKYVFRRKSNRKKSLFAEIVCVHSVSSFDCFLVVKDPTGQELLNELSFSEEPDEFLFNERIGDIKWLSNDVLLHHEKDGSELAKYEFDSNGSGDIKAIKSDGR